MTVWALLETPSLDEGPLVDFLAQQGDLLGDRGAALPDDCAIAGVLAFGSLTKLFLIESGDARGAPRFAKSYPAELCLGMDEHGEEPLG